MSSLFGRVRYGGFIVYIKYIVHVNSLRCREKQFLHLKWMQWPQIIDKPKLRNTYERI